MYFLYRIRQAWNGNTCTGPKNYFINAIFWARYYSKGGKW